MPPLRVIPAARSTLAQPIRNKAALPSQVRGLKLLASSRTGHGHCRTNTKERVLVRSPQCQAVHRGKRCLHTESRNWLCDNHGSALVEKAQNRT